MASIVFRLNNVPEQEADLVRALLTDNNIDFYETDAGRWGISIAALWVKEDQDKQKARALIDDFQVTHSQTMRAQFQEDLDAGRVPSFWQLLSKSPVMVITYWALIAVVVLITIVPIYRFFNA